MANDGTRNSSEEQARLVAQAKLGDSDAFETLVRACIDRLLHLVSGIASSPTDAWDVVQEALLQAWLRIESFRGDASFCTWLRAIALNQSRMLLRSRRCMSSVEHLAEGGDSWEAQAVAINDPSLAERHQMRDTIRVALAALPYHYRVVYWLREAEGLDYMEIARTLQIPIGTVRSRLAATRRLLRQALDKRGDW